MENHAEYSLDLLKDKSSPLQIYLYRYNCTGAIGISRLSSAKIAHWVQPVLRSCYMATRAMYETGTILHIYEHYMYRTA